jgi:hypothetical protein
MPIFCHCPFFADVREVFDLFDFWDGRDGMVDGFKIGDFLRCCGLDPTQALVMANGGTKQLGRFQSYGNMHALRSKRLLTYAHNVTHRGVQVDRDDRQFSY